MKEIIELDELMELNKQDGSFLFERSKKYNNYNIVDNGVNFFVYGKEIKSSKFLILDPSLFFKAVSKIGMYIYEDIFFKKINPMFNNNNNNAELTYRFITYDMITKKNIAEIQKITFSFCDKYGMPKDNESLNDVSDEKSYFDLLEFLNLCILFYILHKLFISINLQDSDEMKKYLKLLDIASDSNDIDNINKHLAFFFNHLKPLEISRFGFVELHIYPIYNGSILKAFSKSNNIFAAAWIQAINIITSISAYSVNDVCRRCGNPFDTTEHLETDTNLFDVSDDVNEIWIKKASKKRKYCDSCAIINKKGSKDAHYLLKVELFNNIKRNYNNIKRKETIIPKDITEEINLLYSPKKSKIDDLKLLDQKIKLLLHKKTTN